VRINLNIRNKCIAFLFFIFIITIFFREAIFVKYYFGNINLFGIYSSLYPEYSNFIKKYSYIPLWNPHRLCGFPVPGEPLEWSLLSPFTILMYLLYYTFHLPNPILINIYKIFSFMLIGWFIFLYMREINLSRLAAFMSGFIFISLPTLLDQCDPNSLNSYIWYGLILYLIEKGMKKKRINYIYIILAAVFYGIQFLGADPNYCYYFSLFLLFYLFFRRLPKLGKGTFKVEKVRESIFIYLLIFIVGVGIAAVQLIPTYELAKHSALIQFRNYQNINEWENLDKEQLLSIVRLNPEKMENYCGILMIIFLAFSLFHKNKSYLKVYFPIIAIFITLGLVRNSSQLKLLCMFLPLFRYLVHNHFMVVFFTFFTCCFAVGLGFEEFIRQSKIKILILVFMLSILLLINWRRLNIYFYFTYIGLIFFSFVFYVWRNRETKCKKVIILSFFLFCLISNYLMWRPFYWQQYMKGELLRALYPQRFDEEYSNIWPLEKFLRDNVYNRIGNYRIAHWDDYANRSLKFYSLDGRSNFIPKRYLEFTKASFDIDLTSEMGYHDFIYYPNLIKLLKCKYVVLNKKEGKWCNIIGEYWKEIFRNERYAVFKFEKPLKHFLFLTDFLVLQNDRKILELLKDSNFDPERVVIIENNPKIRNFSVFRQEDLKYEIETLEYLPQRVKLFLHTNIPGFLLFLDPYYPGWKVYVDGKKNKIYRADFLFRAVYISTRGEHTVEFVYSPFSLKVGAVISFITLVGSIAGMKIAKLSSIRK